MPGLLGSVLSGAAIGAGQADQHNVDLQNKQTSELNLAAAQREMDRLYEQAKELRHAEQGRDARKYTGGLISSSSEEYLKSKGMHSPVANDPDPEHAATDQDVQQAMAIGSAKSGMLDPKVIAETSSKSAIQEAKAAAHDETARAVAQINALGMAGKGKEAAQIAADTKEKLAAQMDQMKKDHSEQTAQLKKEIEAMKILSDYTSTPESKERARAILAGGQPANGALSVDNLFPVK